MCRNPLRCVDVVVSVCLLGCLGQGLFVGSVSSPRHHWGKSLSEECESCWCICVRKRVPSDLWCSIVPHPSHTAGQAGQTQRRRAGRATPSCIALPLFHFKTPVSIFTLQLSKHHSAELEWERKKDREVDRERLQGNQNKEMFKEHGSRWSGFFLSFAPFLIHWFICLFISVTITVKRPETLCIKFGFTTIQINPLNETNNLYMAFSNVQKNPRCSLSTYTTVKYVSKLLKY